MDAPSRYPGETGPQAKAFRPLHFMQKRVRYGLVVLGSILIALAIALGLLIRSAEPRARRHVVEALQERFHADVQLKALHLTLFPTATAVGEELTIRHKSWINPRPLLSIRKFTAETDFFTLLFGRDKIRLVRLEGLEIHIPPKNRRGGCPEGSCSEENASPDKKPGRKTKHFHLAIQTLVADGTLLEIESKDPDNPPLQFDIRKLTMHSVGPRQGLTFTAQLTNAKPPGLIDSSGKFGPWQQEDPGTTPVSGSYKFQNANLGVFKGISGTLSSVGNYGGMLQRIEANGTADIPNFALKAGGAPVHLAAKFHSVIDGMNGDTILDPVEASFLHSEFFCEGGVVRHRGQHSKTVDIDATTKRGRMEDILTLVLGDDKPFLRGDVDFKSRIEIPPGNQDVLDKLNIDGQFHISSAEFLHSNIQRGIETFSERARGISKSEQKGPPDTVASDFRGRFKLDNGVVAFSYVSFHIPGAWVNLHGTYHLESQKIDMLGTLRMKATLSETQSGIKSWLLKPIDPFFRKNGAGFLAHIYIRGTRSHPEPGIHFFGREHDLFRKHDKDKQ